MAETDPRVAREMHIIKQSSSEVADEEGVQNAFLRAPSRPSGKAAVDAELYDLVVSSLEAEGYVWVELRFALHERLHSIGRGSRVDSHALLRRAH